METVEQLIAEWTEMARDLGRQHASGHGSDDQPYDAIDLNSLEAVTGEGTGMGELLDIQTTLEQAYEEGMRDAMADRSVSLPVEAVYGLLALHEAAQDRMLRPGLASERDTVTGRTFAALMDALEDFDDSDQAIVDHYREHIDLETKP